MLEAIGATLTSAVAIAVSPIPIIAVILMLMTPRAGRLSWSFLLGWIVGIVAATTITMLLASVVSTETAGPQPILGGTLLAMGVTLALLGVRQWRSRPAPGVAEELPAWMSRIDGMRAPAAMGLGLALAALNPKNLLVAAAAGAVIGDAGLDSGSTAVAIATFSAVAATTVLVPVVLATVAPQRASQVLAGIRSWLTANNATIMTVLFVVLGANVIGKGLAAF
ncbi:GAP family protein [Gordonia malaquae]|uniref:GAP family protein n=1 Tax=Gordonia malaquae TaxID=410332 RepID=UPI00301B0D8C